MFYDVVQLRTVLVVPPLATIKADDPLLLDASDDTVMESDNAPDASVWAVHGTLHRELPEARVAERLSAPRQVSTGIPADLDGRNQRFASSLATAARSLRCYRAIDRRAGRDTFEITYDICDRIRRRYRCFISKFLSNLCSCAVSFIVGNSTHH